jgi:hypothetical protein
MKTFLQRILGHLNHYDNKISGRLHQLDNIIISCILYPFAAFFHPGLIWIAFGSMFYFSNYSINFLIVYIVGVLFCLLTIYLLKRTLKRYLYFYFKEIDLPWLLLPKNRIISGRRRKIMLCPAEMPFSLHSLYLFFIIWLCHQSIWSFFISEFVWVEFTTCVTGSLTLSSPVSSGLELRGIFLVRTNN